ncbi:GNAT family N-acetyltransferase [Sabulibacter ruber]|uniref:GNAT family N-acetyltransferase n=1 Tax=Sabulibacter ruber TaxID=2811901 RepID=UPI001A97A8CB|nr:GNAT family N-acetyltransferase [Sabulibacter ruber]
MLPIKTPRLQLFPLTLTHLRALVQSRQQLEQMLGLAPSKFELNADPGFLQEFEVAISEYVLPKVEANPEEYAWYTHWLIIHEQLNLTVGGIGVAGKPTTKGETMLGYFIDRKFEGQGIATEAVQGLLSWLFRHPDVTSVIADTLVQHVASQRVLQKNGFKQDGETEEGLRWRLTR